MNAQLSFLSPARVPSAPAPRYDDALLLRLRQEAYGLSGALFIALLDCADAERTQRLKHAQRRAETRYWRRYEMAYPPGNMTPPWFYRTANAGY